MEREDKMKMTCSQEQLAEILRSMADAMDQGSLSLNDVELPWNEVEKIALTIRNAAGMADVKIKISSGGEIDPAEDAEDGDDAEESRADELGGYEVGQDPALAKDAQGAHVPGKPGKPRGSYGSLKKRMKKSFKNIMYALHENTWPSMVDIDEFVRDSADMVRYPGKGDEFYPAYSEAVTVFVDAVQQKNLEAAYQAAHTLNTLKTQCHKKYD
ncbi:GAK system XXXCH domain-containing protein [Desulfonatronum thioautotrophicum]|uniref:GAK system XXXCH domain-containing protein n=1 Tax=Desulfonatronum thioautotrophicum TaxID=617001 RepID=UPI00069BBE69|nr:GAK system XXXCH domain-containing protein [Desulfonatronum thioautotrophicum]